jgi:DNA polymerase I-like protein with 3'-5' exonuclease and polymerase domains
MDIPTLDIETSPRNGADESYALQPWRVREGTAGVDNIALGKANGQAFVITKPTQFRALLASQAGKTIAAYNAVFDVAFLMASGYTKEVKAINWVDPMLVWKWLDNSQRTDRMPAWTLADAVKRFFKNEVWAQEFIAMKSEKVEAGQNDEYWEKRAKLDSIMTSRVLIAAWSLLDARRRKSCMITMASIIPCAESWERGVIMDYNLIQSITPAITAEMAEIEYKLGVHNNPHSQELMLGDNGWTPSKILRSPKQLADLLYETWHLTAKSFSEKTQKPSTDKAALTYLADDNPDVIEILRWRMLNTQLSKYIQSPLKSRAYLGNDVVHPQARIFSTYTGRMTYSSKTKKKYPTGIALHQWPRKKEFRALIVPRPGYKHVEYDAASQESRIMADQSGDPSMQEVFRNNMDFHSYTGSKLAGITYEDFLKGKAAGNVAITGEHGLRYQGKFCNLSNNFRIGVKKLRITARVQYGMNVDFMTAQQWQTTFHRELPGVKEYWKRSIALAKMQGHTDTMAGRRFKLMYWDKESKWSTESSSLMFPIQGSGADMKDLAIQEIGKYFPDHEFWFDLHDGLHYEVPVDVPESRLLEVREMLDNIDYQKWWGYTPKVPLKWDASVGPRWSDLKEL